MELAAAAMTALSSAAAPVTSAVTSALGIGAPMSLTGGAAGAAASAGGLGSLFGGSSWLTLLQGGSMALSAMATLNAGQEKSDSLLAAANDATMQAGTEQIAGQQRQASLKRQAADQMAERDAAFAASGVDLSFGTPKIAKAQDVLDSERALAIDQGNTDATVARLKERAANYQSAAKSARSASVMKAVLTGADGVLGINRRGVFGGR